MTLGDCVMFPLNDRGKNEEPHRRCMDASRPIPQKRPLFVCEFTSGLCHGDIDPSGPFKCGCRTRRHTTENDHSSGDIREGYRGRTGVTPYVLLQNEDVIERFCGRWPRVVDAILIAFENAPLI